MQEPAILQALIESPAPFHGVAVAIGINDYDMLRDKFSASSGSDSLEALNRMVESLLRENLDMGCRAQEDEFVMLFPGEAGADAQRRLFQVSEKLWDFQLRSLGHLSVMFSWGGLEIQGEPVADAVASARERMFQTKRNRKGSNVGFATVRRVVNG
jgi:GGDEF domain-containing protein